MKKFPCPCARNPMHRFGCGCGCHKTKIDKTELVIEKKKIDTNPWR